MINEDVLKIVLNNKSFGKYEAASIVGGLKRLKELCESGRIKYKTKEGVPPVSYTHLTLPTTERV